MDRRKEGGWWEPSTEDKRAPREGSTYVISGSSRAKESGIPEDSGHTKYVDPDVHWIGMVCAIESQLEKVCRRHQQIVCIR